MGDEEMPDPLDTKNFSTAERMRAAVEELTRQMDGGSGMAAYNLSLVYDPGNAFVPDHLREVMPASREKSIEIGIRAYHLLLCEAERGNGRSMHAIASYYRTAQRPVESDMAQCRDWCEKSLAAGYLFAANDLYSIYSDSRIGLVDKARAEQMWDLLECEGIRMVPRNPYIDLYYRIWRAKQDERLEHQPL